MTGMEDISPRFVVQAASLLEAGKIDEAVAACQAGIQEYPWYVTGYWILGKCYEAEGNPIAAHSQYREVARRLQRLPSVAAALERTSKGKLPASVPPVTDMEDLLRRLQEAKRVVPPPPGPSDAPLVDMSIPRNEGPIVTATLAEIYAQQGEYREALEAYKRLIQQRPDEAGRHAHRMAELELLLQGADKLRQP